MHDIIIIGGGIAAFTAALYSARRGLSILVIAKDIGGQANSTDLIENYPGVEETRGYDLINTIKQQAEGFGAETLMSEASKIKPIENGFVVTAYGKQYKASSIILAYGKTPMDLGVPGEEEFKGKGISYCVTCDSPLFKGKVVAVVGMGDINLEACLIASKFAKKVYVLSKTDKLIGHPSLLKAVTKNKRIELTPFVKIDSIEGKKSVEKLRLTDLRSNLKRSLEVNGVFVELGYVVDSKIAAGLVDLDSIQQVKVDAQQATSHPGIFAVGDCTNRHYKQAVISAGEAATAALAAYDWLMRRKGGSGLTSDWTQIKRMK